MKIYALMLLLGTIAAYAHLFATTERSVDNKGLNERLS